MGPLESPHPLTPRLLCLLRASCGGVRVCGPHRGGARAAPPLLFAGVSLLDVICDFSFLAFFFNHKGLGVKRSERYENKMKKTLQRVLRMFF